MRRHLLLCATLLLCLASSPALAASIAITHCGVVVNGTGILMQNLDCSDTMTAAVWIEKGRLLLNGKTITIGFGTGVYCEGNCTVSGPGP